MALQQISPNSVVTNPAYVNPQVRSDETAGLIQSGEVSNQAVRQVKSDTVTISEQALQKLSDESGTTQQGVQNLSDQSVIKSRKPLKPKDDAVVGRFRGYA